MQQVIESKIENITCQKFDVEVKEKKVELIKDNDMNEEIVIIENNVEDSIEVKYEDESITHNPQALVDLLKMATQYVDFLEVENFNFWKICDEEKVRLASNKLDDEADGW